MTREMLINTVEGQECRIALLEGGRLEELYVERVSSASRVGNIYKGRIVNVEPAIQAAFVDFGAVKNGFLHISDVHPQYFPKGNKGPEPVGRKRSHHERPPIQECLRRGQEVVVQMTKEGIGTKGPSLTTYLSIPGRLLVMMPGMSRLGVSRKIEDEESRQKLKDIFEGIQLPPDIGFIIRTAGQDRSKRDIQRDLNYLLRLWKTVGQHLRTAKAPAEIYKESDLVARTIRDIYNTDITRIVCDTEAVAAQVRAFLEVVVPRCRTSLEVYQGKGGLFHDFDLEKEIESIHSRRVELASGGSLVIDPTEALVAIDVNSGRYREHADSETTAFKINLEAAKEVARQLRLRDLGGVIIIDFIDMYREADRRAVEKALRDAMKSDRAKAKFAKISAFGIVEMTRQRVRPSLKDSLHRACPYCQGRGVVKSEESLALEVIRELQRAAAHEEVVRIEVAVNPDVAIQLSNNYRKQLSRLESETGRTVFIRPDQTLPGNGIRISCQNGRGSEVAWQQIQPGKGGRPGQSPTVSVLQQARPGRGRGQGGRGGGAQRPQQPPRQPQPQEALKPAAPIAPEAAPAQVPPPSSPEPETVQVVEAPVAAIEKPPAAPAVQAEPAAPPQAEAPQAPAEPARGPSEGQAQPEGEGPPEGEGEPQPAKRRKKTHRAGRKHRRKKAGEQDAQGRPPSGAEVVQPDEAEPVRGPDEDDELSESDETPEPPAPENPDTTTD
jgi:ribonuclease E